MNHMAPKPMIVSKPPAWLWVMPLVSCGFLAAVPPLVVASKLKQSAAWLWAISIAGSSLVGFVLAGSQPGGEDSFLTNAGAALFLGSGLASIIFVLMMGPKADWHSGRMVYPPPAPMMMQPQPLDPNSAAIAAVEAARLKRSQARELVGRDPQMARDLRVGRPDLTRNFDDGGLVDINSAPAPALVQWLGLENSVAEHVVATRQRLGRFQHPDDLMIMAELDPSAYDKIRDRIILM